MLSAIGVAAALVAAWAPAPKFSLVCSGVQTGYQELTETFQPGSSKLTLPWSETLTIDLNGGTYCSQACASLDPISSISATELDLDNVSTPDASSVKRFLVSGGAYQSAEIIGDSSTGNRFHLEKTGTCTIQP